MTDLSEPMRLALLKGSSQIVERIAQCVGEGIDDGSIAKNDAGKTAELSYNIWLGASLMINFHSNADSLQRAMQTTTSILTGNTAI